jgi:aerobic-type carbon monoxide dehydrogenase small subunit (CoxS/CutS family)
VRLDGHPVCACLVPVAQVSGRSVETVEGLAADGRLDRLQAAFLEHGAAQAVVAALVRDAARVITSAALVSCHVSNVG